MITRTLLRYHLTRSPQNRRAAVLNYFADGTYSDSDEELLKGTGIIPKVQIIELNRDCMTDEKRISH